jgi:hypothetical protein
MALETILKSLLTKLGVDFETYLLVNNHGITWKTDEFKIDIRHWLNVYGVSTDYWDMTVSKNHTEKYEHVARYDINKEMTQTELVELIKKYV